MGGIFKQIRETSKLFFQVLRRFAPGRYYTKCIKDGLGGFVSLDNDEPLCIIGIGGSLGKLGGKRVLLCFCSCNKVLLNTKRTNLVHSKADTQRRNDFVTTYLCNFAPL